MATRKYNNFHAVVDRIVPQLVDDNSVETGYIDISKWTELVFSLNVGATDTTVDAKIVEAKTSGGGSAQDLTGAAITQITGSGDNKVAIINVRNVDVSQDYTHVKMTVTVGDGTTGAYVAAQVVGLDKKTSVTSSDDSSAIVEVVTL